MEMFDNYKNLDCQPKPDNRHRFCQVDTTDEIVVGGTAEHVFKLNFLYSEVCDNYEISYKQGADCRLIVINGYSYEAPVPVEEHGKTVIVVKLTPDQTAIFNPHRATFAQIKLFMKNGDVIYGEKNRIKVISTLDGGW